MLGLEPNATEGDIEEAYKAIDWKVIFLLGGILPLGLAMEQMFQASGEAPAGS